MDFYLTCAMARWRGVVKFLGPSPGGFNATTVAHGQPVAILHDSLKEEHLYMIYDAKVEACGSSFRLCVEDPTEIVPIPFECSFHEIKEVFAGIGCIGHAAHFAGFTRLASMDINQIACQVLQANSVPGIIQGDILNSADRKKLHLMPYPSRCLLTGGFPCQPLSQQGDKLGADDPRSAPFFALLDTMWEQQMAALIMECVPGAQSAAYIQKAIQKLGFSMGLEIRQIVLNLDRTWPTRRTRWWCLMLPTRYTPVDMQDLPMDEHFQTVGQLLSIWPLWHETDEADLALTHHEIELLEDRNLGTDVRHLELSSKCPCLLHSYANFDRGCPCGCRSHGFSMARLQKGGLRGFYVLTPQGNKRFLHPKEASLLCSIMPDLTWPTTPRTALCLIGQCAAPIQALWVLGHLKECLGWAVPDSSHHLLLQYKALLLRAQYGTWNVTEGKSTEVIDAASGVLRKFSITGNPPIIHFLQAEAKLARTSSYRLVHDAYGPLPDNHCLRRTSVMGPYILATHDKKQARSLGTTALPYSLQQEQLEIAVGTIAEGSYIICV